MSPRPNPSIADVAPIPAAAGIGLRFQHHRLVDEMRPDVSWFEIHSENYMGGGTSLKYLEAIRRDYPISCHCVGLSLGSAEGLNLEHLERLRTLAERIQPGLISDHLSWSISDGTYLADLLPLPLTEESLEIVCENVSQVQDVLKRAILIENPSTYLQFCHSAIPEWAFLASVVERTGCQILCDVNNIYVSAQNHGWDALAYLRELPANAIGEIHLAGHATRILDDGLVLRIDDHGSRVAPSVWSLYSEALELFGPTPTLIEWDTDVPAFDLLREEAATAQKLLEQCRAKAGHALVA